ncbi:MAG: DUF3298 domain-containing protein [Gemmatimonadales bacterium]|nr:MAG: DUF3298 domain-containing protein [Gemmatimonadales bacterium]
MTPARAPRLLALALLVAAAPVLAASCSDGSEPRSDLDEGGANLHGEAGDTAAHDPSADPDADAGADDPGAARNRARAALDWPQATVERDEPEGLRVRLSFPEAEGDSPLADAVRGWTRDRMTATGLGEGGRASTPEAAADTFQTRYQAFRDDFPDAPQQWFLERHVRVEEATSRWVTLSVEESTYTGGAHPSYALGWVNLDPASGQVLDLDALFLPDARPELLELLDAELRASFQLEDNRPLTDVGLFDETLSEPGTFALEGSGVRFLWNPYEIGPWSMGPIEVTLAWAELIPLLRDPTLAEAAGETLDPDRTDPTGTSAPGARRVGPQV